MRNRNNLAGVMVMLADWVFAVIYEEGGSEGSLVRDAAGNLYGATGSIGGHGYVMRSPLSYRG